jgi:predicted amidophosphoribosyltransferase
MGEEGMIPQTTTCPACQHILEGCDDDCHCCGQCYSSSGKEVCNKVCKHAKHLDDGGFLIDGNHPDDMFSIGRKG